MSNQSLDTPAHKAAPALNGLSGCRFDSRELFKSRQEVLIEHAGQVYRLRITRQNKLILTK
jgi:hemin uptake protein HemP